MCQMYTKPEFMYTFINWKNSQNWCFCMYLTHQCIQIFKFFIYYFKIYTKNMILYTFKVKRCILKNMFCIHSDPRWLQNL